MAARQRQTYGEEVANVLTHGAGMLFGMTAIIILMMAAIRSGNPWAIGSFAVYVVYVTLVCDVYIYHASTRATERLLRRFDHGAIYCILRNLYAFTLLALRQGRLLGLVTIRRHMDRGSGRCLAEFQEDEKKDHLKTVCYLAMGWVVIIAFKPTFACLS